jgi:hypothetical protein
MPPDGGFKTRDTNSDVDDATKQEKTRGEPGREAPGAQNADDSHNYDTASDKSSASARQRAERTGLRRAQRHASWRDVARACHVDPEGHR